MTVKTEEAFIELVKKAEREAEAHPKSYTTKLAFLALLGYLVIFLVLVALLGLAGGLVATAFFSTGLFILLLKNKLIIAVLAGIWVLLRALWIKFTPPQGYSLKRRDFPELFVELDTLRKQLKSLKVHEVILDTSLNAAVVQHPRLGILGWHKNYLMLGYQLLLALSPEEMRAVLAHEFGHLSNNHSRFNGWIYRIRLTWFRVMEAFNRAECWGGNLMRKFFNWYTPQFDAYSFALARNNEYQADAIAAELTSPKIAARALVNVYATAPYLDRNYWNNYFRLADEHERPPHAPFQGLSDFLKEKPLTNQEMLDRIEKQMAVKTHYADTHPSLSDRVKALGVGVQTPAPLSTSAAEVWLGKNNRKVMEYFDREWFNGNGESWKQRYEYVANAKTRLQAFAQTPSSELEDKDLWDYAYWTNEFETGEAALPLFTAFQERYPDDPDTAYQIGMIMLGKDDAAGLDQLRVAMKSADLIERVAYAGYDFLKQKDEPEKADAWWQESIRQNEIFVEARNERASVTGHDQFVYPEIDDQLLQQLTTNLKRQKGVGKVWLAQKSVQYFPESPVYIVAFKLKPWSFSTGNAQVKVAKNLQVAADCFVVCKKRGKQSLANKVIKAGKRIL